MKRNIQPLSCTRPVSSAQQPLAAMEPATECWAAHVRNASLAAENAAERSPCTLPSAYLRVPPGAYARVGAQRAAWCEGPGSRECRVGRSWKPCLSPSALAWLGERILGWRECLYIYSLLLAGSAPESTKLSDAERGVCTKAVGS